jgi:hypothetical protein
MTPTKASPSRTSAASPLRNPSSTTRAIAKWSRAALGLALASALAGCGSGGDLLTPSGACAPSTTPTTAPPYAVEFQFRNDTSAPLYVLQDCSLYDFGISSCASGFADRLNEPVICASFCGTGGGGLQCGACPENQGTAIAPGASLRRAWDGLSTTTMATSNGQCVNRRALPAGRYRAAIWVYASEADALAREAPRVVTRDFELPAANGVVDVPLGASADDECDHSPNEPTKACTGGEPREQPCDVPAALTFADEGGLVARSDSETLMPPSTDVRTRMTFGASATTKMCTTQVPRCSRDARVTTTADVTRALAAPGVAASFGSDRPVYGADPRVVDGSVLFVTRADGKSLGIGGSCASGCARPLTPALATLGSVLHALSAQQLRDAACATLNASP